jgi:DNA-binding NarL/FixJ family response regulator
MTFPAEQVMARLLIADNHPLLLDGIEASLKGTDNEVVLRCTRLEELLPAIETLEPELVLFGFTDPLQARLAVLKDLREHISRIIVVAASTEAPQILEFPQVEIYGCVLRESASYQLLKCLREVRGGKRWIDPGISVSARRDAMFRLDASHTTSLTSRELDIVRLVAQGLRNKEIARRASISEGTVKAHVHRIYRKVGVASRTELMLFAANRRIG